MVMGLNIYPNYENVNRCLMRLYEKNTSLLPTTKKNTSLDVHAKKKPTAKCCHLDYPLGINTITPLVKDLCKSVGAADGNFRNQYLRAMMATRMYNQGQDEQLIQEFMGHMSSCVGRYKHASDTFKRKASKIIQGAKKLVVSKLS